MFTKYLILNSVARILSAIRTTLFLYLFGMSHDLGAVLYLIALIGQALVFGSIYDIIACKLSFTSENKAQLNRLSFGLLGLSLSIFATLIAISDKSKLDLTSFVLISGGITLLAMYAFGYEVTRARSSGKNITIAYAQGFVSFSFLIVFVPLSILIDENAILLGMAISNILGWGLLRFGRLQNTLMQAMKARVIYQLPDRSRNFSGFYKTGLIYFLFSLLHTADKVVGGYLLSQAELAGYLIAFSMLMMLRASLNVEQYFASELRVDGAERTIAVHMAMITAVFTMLILVMEGEITSVIKLIGSLDTDTTAIFSGSFRTLVLSWPILTFIAVINRTNVKEVGFTQIFVGAILAFAIWLVPICFFASQIVEVSLTFLASTIIFAGVLFFRYMSSLVSWRIVQVILGVAASYFYASLSTPTWLDFLVFAFIGAIFSKSILIRR